MNTPIFLVEMHDELLTEVVAAFYTETDALNCAKAFESEAKHGETYHVWETTLYTHENAKWFC